MTQWLEYNRERAAAKKEAAVKKRAPAADTVSKQRKCVRISDALVTKIIKHSQRKRR